jgi:hypothetical protein
MKMWQLESCISGAVIMPWNGNSERHWYNLLQVYAQDSGRVKACIAISACLPFSPERYPLARPGIGFAGVSRRKHGASGPDEICGVGAGLADADRVLAGIEGSYIRLFKENSLPFQEG